MLHAWSLTRWLAQGREEAGVRVRPDSVSPSCPEPAAFPWTRGVVSRRRMSSPVQRRPFLPHKVTVRLT